MFDEEGGYEIVGIHAVLDVWIPGCTPVHVLPGKLGSTAKSRSNRA